MEKTFCLRIDVDTRQGTREGIPLMLDALRKMDLKASFYLVMGREPGFWFHLKKRIFKNEYKNWFTPMNRPERYIKVSRQEFLRRLFAPVNYAEENSELFSQLISEGHELGVHGFNHDLWGLKLPSIDPGEDLRKCVEKYEELFGKKPDSFAAPGFTTDARVLEALDKQGFVCAGDLPGEKPFRPIIDGKKFKHVQVPVNLKCADTVPLLEDFFARRVLDNVAVKEVCKMISQKTARGFPAVLYGHDGFECAVKIDSVRQILSWVKKQGYEVMTCRQLAKKFGKNHGKAVFLR